ncbi:Retrovirus-related Pol polyprotein from type-2 retrotransposable element R2DM [Trichinella nelsoni]|uniref:Retrovirus-related Pol polyprotein from type-2 retrotransposable element R2DM n=1 Tax=Trichinella nelsoni TaxID=6336 RepID=A0A0V0REC0_9BILA|nr:Retrovirus-related Pol polyprotein from type-2 retrotransposable element R2DM [Trichinella nelsoni]
MELHFKCVHNIRDFVFRCSKCEKSCPSINSVASHYPRCKGSVKAAVLFSSLANTRTTCGSSCGTFSGLQLHRKRAHPDVFAASCSKKTKARWSDDEISLLATLEAGLDPACKNINQILAERLMEYDITRSVEMIKGQRRKEQYKALVLELRSKPETEKSVNLAESKANNLPVKDTMSFVVSQVTSTYPEYGAAMSCDLIKDATGTANLEINELQNKIQQVLTSGRNPLKKASEKLEIRQKKMANPRVPLFKRFQRLFRSNRRKLASHILDRASLGSIRWQH